MTEDRILNILKELHGKNKCVEACMVARKGLEGVVMFPQSFKDDVGPVWEPLGKTLNEVLHLVEQYNMYGLDRICLETLGFCVSFYVLELSDTALVIFLKQNEDGFKNLLSIMPEIEKARKNITER